MPVTRRQTKPESNGHAHPASTSTMETDPLLHAGLPSASPARAKKGRAALLSYAESKRLVPWQTDNDYVLSGYRPQIPSLLECMKSAFTYVHNETVNIHTHSLGAMFFALLLPLHLLPTHFPSLAPFLPLPHSHSAHADPTPSPPTWQDRVCLSVYLLCAVSCLGLSSWFHTVSCHSKGVCDAAHRGDYIGIVILIVGSILPGMYYSFHGSPVLQLIYMAAILIAGITSAYIVLSPHHRAHRWHRTLTFIALGLSAVIPVLHVILTRGLAFARQKCSLDLVLLGGASYIFGAVLYAARCPEHLAPGRFDILGSSHQIFHVFVLVGAWLQYAALRGMVWGRGMAVGETWASKGL